MGVKSSSASGDMDVTKPGGVVKAVKLDTVDGSIEVVRQSMSTMGGSSLGPRLASFKGMISPLKELKGRKLVPIALFAVAQSATFLWQHGPSLASFASSQSLELYRLLVTQQASLLAMVAFLVSVICVAWLWFLGPPATYLVDYALFKPEDKCKMTSERFLELAANSGFFTEQSLEFQRKILNSSGLGPETYIPLSMHAEPVDFTHKTTMKEAELALFTPVADLLRKTGVKAKEIGILVVNCTFCPIPSLSSMVVNHFGMRENVETYNLGGMGCSAGVIAISLAQDLLKVHKNTYAIVLSTEMISGMQVYTGNERSMMVGNCIFRWGASAVLLSNKRSDRRRSKYSLQHVVRTHHGAISNSFGCVKNLQDPAGIIGVSLSKELVDAAAFALKSNITTLAPKILPLWEKLKFAANFIGRKLLHLQRKPYTPDLQTAIDHFCVHPGGKAVLDGIEKNLSLSKHHMEPSRMTLHRFGNTSSSSIWYVLAYIEAKNRVRKGDLVWQIALGSGIKCNSAIWKSLKSDHVTPKCENPWMDCVKTYPVECSPPSSRHS